MGKAKGSKTGRKIGRNATKCATYRAKGRRELNRTRRLLHHVKNYPADLVAAALL